MKRPEMRVRVVRSPDLGVIGVGEGTTPLFPDHQFGYPGIKPAAFYAQASPTWKLVIRFRRRDGNDHVLDEIGGERGDAGRRVM